MRCASNSAPTTTKCDSKSTPTVIKCISRLTQQQLNVLQIIPPSKWPTKPMPTTKFVLKSTSNVNEVCLIPILTTKCDSKPTPTIIKCISRLTQQQLGVLQIIPPSKWPAKPIPTTKCVSKPTSNIDEVWIKTYPTNHVCFETCPQYQWSVLQNISQQPCVFQNLVSLSVKCASKPIPTTTSKCVLYLPTLSMKYDSNLSQQLSMYQTYLHYQWTVLQTYPNNYCVLWDLPLISIKCATKPYPTTTVCFETHL